MNSVSLPQECFALDVHLGTTDMYIWGCPTCASQYYQDVHVEQQ